MEKCIFLYGESVELNLFKIAIKFAESGLRTWFFAPEPFAKLPPTLGFPEKHILQLITFIYSDRNEIHKSIKNVYLLKNVPHLIIVYKIECYFEQDLSASAFLVATIRTLIEYCSCKLEMSTYFIAGLTETHKEKENFVQTLIDFYFDHVIHTENISKLHNVINFL